MFSFFPGIGVDIPLRDVSVSDILSSFSRPHSASRELVHEFRHRTLVLVKALILQKKVNTLVAHFQQRMNAT